MFDCCWKDKGIKCAIKSLRIAIGWLLEAQYRDLRCGYSNLGLAIPPGLKPPRLQCQIGVVFARLVGKETFDVTTDSICW